MKLVKVGKLINTHGLGGALVMQVLTDSPEIFEEIEYMMLSKGGDVKASFAVENMSDYKGNILVELKGVSDIDEALKYKGMDVVVPEEILPVLDEDEIYWHEFVGSLVLDSNGAEVGTLVDYMDNGPAEVFRIKSENGYYLISNNTDHVLEINVKEKKLVVERSGLVSEEI